MEQESQSRLRILHVSPYGGRAWGYGGIPRVCAALIAEQARMGHAVTLCTTDARDSTGRLEIEPESTGRSPRSLPREGPDERLFRNLSNRVAYHLQFFLPIGMATYLGRAAENFDVAHLHGCHHLPGVLAARALDRAAVPYVLAPNGTAPRIERRRALKWIFDETLGRQVLPRASAVLAVSHVERRQLIALGVAPEKISVVPNPVHFEELDTPPAPGSFRQRFGLGRAPIITYLGRLSPRKRLDLLAAAFRRVIDLPKHSEEPPVLVIAGSDMGAEGALREQIHRLGLSKRVLFTGLLEARQRLPLLVDSDIVVYPGTDEIFGLVPMEALACDTPVLVSDDSGCGEWVSRLGAEVFPAGDAVELALALERLLADACPAKARAARAGARARSWFSPEAVCRQLDEVYARALAHATASRCLPVAGATLSHATPALEERV